MVKKTKEVDKKTNVVETLKTEAKEYYKGKNMVVRYIILWFLVILLAIQFILPHKKSKSLENINAIISKNSDVVDSVDDTDNFYYLWQIVNLKKLDVLEKIRFDNAVHQILSNDISYIYKISQLYLPMMQEIFEEYDVPTDLIYLSMVDAANPRWVLSEFTRKQIWIMIDSDVYEPFNLKKSTQAIAIYFNSLYDELEDWNLVALAYGMDMWGDQLNAEILYQWTDEFDELYVYSDEYYMMMWYSYIFQNLEDYIDVSDIDLYDLDISTITVSEVKDLIKWCKKNKQSYKVIKELNPWILWNSLPKWKREITILE